MKILNKTAKTSFRVLEKLEAGIVLTGYEVKAIRGGHVDLNGSYVRIVGNEAYLVNAKIYPFTSAHLQNYDEGRSRKLLLHRKEISALKSRLERGNLTIVPLNVYTTHNLVKLDIALAYGKKRFDHREDIKKRVQEREAQREAKNLTSKLK